MDRRWRQSGEVHQEACAERMSLRRLDERCRARLSHEEIVQRDLRLDLVRIGVSNKPFGRDHNVK